MKLEELYEHIEKDFSIDKFELVNESVKSGKLFSKYIRWWSEHKLELENLDLKKTKLINEKRDYYSGNALAEVYKEKPFSLKIKTEAGMQSYIDSDEDILDFKQKYNKQKQICLLLDECVKELKSRNYYIKNAIDTIKFENGC